jgi:hypothetical protein
MQGCKLLEVGGKTVEGRKNREKIPAILPGSLSTFWKLASIFTPCPLREK